MIKKGISKITITSIITGIFLFGQFYQAPYAEGISLFGGSSEEKQETVVESGPVEAVHYYAGLAAKENYIGFENVLIPPDSETNNPQNDSDEDVGLVIINNALVGSSGFFDNNRSIITYEVKLGDTPSEIADEFGISTSTMLWANNLTIDSATRIKPGDKLVILPISGVRHTIKASDTVSGLAKKYSADAQKIISYNNMTTGEPLEVGSIMIIPDGKMPVPPKPKTPKIALVSVSKNDNYNVSAINTLVGDTHPPARSHKFPWGQCTYYVALKRYVPWRGNAQDWLKNAATFGYKTGKTPVVGSIVITIENRRYGHSAYVEAVDGNKITISDMNFVGLGIKSVRVLPTNSQVIRGYIY
ncbi:LysM peptidoglycan-binding domain-containing protein [Patescibacteria group bacterium]|nr:LysM peptidoglycan-binding domain-containing protein [Patescibacteria group bacterium]MBU4000284.1 LysM peptidoglycan-binding domain-containing protein [Patescibacteria group bacterium]MBU4368472.1 LysM peptidoglycan-binding domain-containing protein [Patescibacteria group bacterium]